jgi:hypothetical protein
MMPQRSSYALALIALFLIVNCKRHAGRDALGVDAEFNGSDAEGNVLQALRGDASPGANQARSETLIEKDGTGRVMKIVRFYRAKCGTIVLDGDQVRVINPINGNSLEISRYVDGILKDQYIQTKFPHYRSNQEPFSGILLRDEVDSR